MLEHARTLHQKRKYAELAQLLEPLQLEQLLAEPQLGYWLADAHRRLGRTRQALELTRAIAPVANRLGGRLPHNRLNLEGMLHFESGDLPGAEAAWLDLLSQASNEKSDEFVARANNNLGIIYTMQMRPIEAVTAYERAIAAYRVIGQRRGIAQSFQNLGITYRELGRADEADEHFTTALRYAREDGSEDEMARAEQERALLFYSARGDARLARGSVVRAIQRFTALADPLGLADALRVLAMIELGEGNLDEASQHTQRALEELAGRHPLHEAELLEVAAAIAQRLNDSEKAAALRARAEQLFASAHATAWGRAFRARIAELPAPM